MTIDHNSHHCMSQNRRRMLMRNNINIYINKPNNNNNKHIINKIITTTTTNKANSDNVHYQQTLHKEDKQLIYKEILLIRIQISNMVIVQEMSSIITKVINKGINKYYSHLGIVLKYKGGIGIRIIRVNQNMRKNKDMKWRLNINTIRWRQK